MKSCYKTIESSHRKWLEKNRQKSRLLSSTGANVPWSIAVVELNRVAALIDGNNEEAKKALLKHQWPAIVEFVRKLK